MVNASIKAIIKMMLGYCKMSQNGIKLIHSENQINQVDDADEEGELNDLNTFLITFLESDEDQLNCISIRLSVNEFIDQIINESSLTIYGHAGFSQVLQQCVDELYQSQVSSDST